MAGPTWKGQPIAHSYNTRTRTGQYNMKIFHGEIAFMVANMLLLACSAHSKSKQALVKTPSYIMEVYLGFHHFRSFSRIRVTLSGRQVAKKYANIQ